MPADPPINFESLSKSGGNSAAGGYPYQIKAVDLQKNFVYATNEFAADEFIETESSGNGGHTQRKVSLKYPIPTPSVKDQILSFDGESLKWFDPPKSGTHVLGCVNGTLQWLATEEC